MMGSEINNIEELFESLQKYQERFKELMRENEFVFDRVDLLYFYLHWISLKRSGALYD